MACPVVAVQADSGAIGGKQSEEFIFLTEIGEDNIILCPSCGYAANQERAEFTPRNSRPERSASWRKSKRRVSRRSKDWPTSLTFLAQSTAKAAFFLVDGQPTFAVIRGDLEVNELKLINALDALEARPLLPEEVEAAGWVAGYASPIGVDPARVIADPSVVEAGGLVAGANRVGMHARNVTYGRDWTAATVADIGMAQPGDTCSECDDALEMRRGIELGHIFKLGTRYAEPMEATFLDADGERRTPIMGCYGIGVERLMAAAVQANHDDLGIIWPRSIAPYDVHIVPLGGSDDVGSAVASIEAELAQLGLNVLTDDRDERAGVKFNDADLMGAPLRITIGARGLRQGQIELKLRHAAESSSVPIDDAVTAAQEALASLDG